MYVESVATIEYMRNIIISTTFLFLHIYKINRGIVPIYFSYELKFNFERHNYVLRNVNSFVISFSNMLPVNIIIL